MIRKECLSTPVLLRPPSPWAGLQCSSSHPLVASRIAGSAGRSVRRPRQPHRRERRLGHGHVPGPPCNRSGGHERAVQRVCAADVRCAGRLRSSDPPALPRGSPPASDANSGSCVALADVRRPLLRPQLLTSRPCARGVFTSSPHRGPGRSAVGGCGPVWCVRGDNLQLQTVTDARGGSDASGNGLSGTESGPRGRDHGTPCGHRDR